MRELKDRVAVVTGAAAGIGRAIALELARAGMHVALADVDEPGMQRVATDIEALGRRALCVTTDVRERAAIERLLKRTLAELGGCHVAVNNAGVFHASTLDRRGRAAVAAHGRHQPVGRVHGCRVFGAHFAAQGVGHIVNTASAACFVPAPAMSAYSTTKFGGVRLQLAVRLELAISNVGVTVRPRHHQDRHRQGRGRRARAHESGRDGEARAAAGRARAQGRARGRRDSPVVLFGFEAYLAGVLRLMPMWLIDPIGKAATRNALGSLQLPADTRRP